MNFSSKLLEQAVDEFSSLPGIGKKTALRLVMHLLKQEEQKVTNFSSAILKLRQDAVYCNVCNNLADAILCDICSSASRKQDIICVVSDLRDIIAIENTAQFFGTYHVLGGIISPMEGIGPSDLNIDSLIKRTETNVIKEVILALKGTMEGDTTAFYLFKKLKDKNCLVSIISRGIGIGDELEYADELSLGRSILQRTPFENTLKA
jgi:recombination protein RecR